MGHPQNIKFRERSVRTAFEADPSLRFGMTIFMVYEESAMSACAAFL